jgi:hypothetical protein
MREGRREEGISKGNRRRALNERGDMRGRNEKREWKKSLKNEIGGEERKV